MKFKVAGYDATTSEDGEVILLQELSFEDALRLEAALKARAVKKHGAEPKVATREDVKDVYAEGLTVGMEIGKKLDGAHHHLNGSRESREEAKAASAEAAALPAIGGEKRGGDNVTTLPVEKAPSVPEDVAVATGFPTLVGYVHKVGTPLAEAEVVTAALERIQPQVDWLSRMNLRGIKEQQAIVRNIQNQRRECAQVGCKACQGAKWMVNGEEARA